MILVFEWKLKGESLFWILIILGEFFVVKHSPVFVVNFLKYCNEVVFVFDCFNSWKNFFKVYLKQEMRV